ncbi:MAG: methyltransferase domain-containing protein [Proteobacteria bacterium]|nr:methyltransferase domain-containing protein [Pseudomonadota bacterium]MBU1450329.1 methyltransferase domain-containing protein [Pseudomonadota bacterium]MBU2470748.1 methyltransferase domain-containing protein [Pseudomonadota bacterium]MBU2518465.1 methyltransferase domain-containing protein [Pseudomonadota bacterium]
MSHDQRGHAASANRQRRGPSSYAMQDAQRLWRILALGPGHALADLGCGPGDYALEAARRVGPGGRVWALDRDPRLLASLANEAKARGLENLTTLAADLREPLPLQDLSVDLCLLATVLHVIKFTLAGGGLFGEIKRVLRPRGRLAVLNCSLADLSFGPPEHLRIAPPELDRLVSPQGFRREHLEDMGFNYLALYRKT